MKLNSRKGIAAVATVGTSAALVVVAIAAPAAATGISSYSTSLTPSSVIAGSTGTYTFTFTNTSTGIGTLFNLGSVAVTPPTGFTVSGPFTASASNGSNWTASQTGSTICLSSGTALGPGQKASLSLGATAGSVNGQWTTAGYPSAHCSGLLGSFPYLANNQPTTQVDRLAWSQQPPDGAKTGTALNPAPQVSAYNGATVDSAFTGPVTVALNPATGGLTGATTANAANGTATFANLAITSPGNGYTLLASSNGSPGTASRAFDVGTSGSSTPCPASQGCQSPVVSSTSGSVQTETQVIADPAAPADRLNVTVGGMPPLACSGTQRTATMSFTVPTRTALVRLANDDDRDSDYLHGTAGKTTNIFNAPITPANLHPVCYTSDQSFVDVNGNLVTVGFLPACAASGNVRPCVQAEWAEVETIDRHGRPVVDYDEYEADILAPAGDPGVGLH
jgi:hypothetical protein